jgi:hypothetical protein
MSSLREGQGYKGAISGLVVALAWLACGPTGVRHVVPGKVKPDAAVEEGGAGGGDDTGGRPGTGGRATGGSPGTGGDFNTGGSTGGKVGTGGDFNTGGSSATGGNLGTGGSVPPDAAPDLAPDLAPDGPEMCVTGTSGTFMNTPMPSKTGTFTVRFSVTPTAAPTNGIVALSMGAGMLFADYAVSVRFSPMGMIDVINGANYEATPAMTYAQNAVYRVRLTVNVTAHTYSAYVTPPGGNETRIGNNLAFRTQQATVNRLDSWGVAMQGMATGSLKACGFTVE